MAFGEGKYDQDALLLQERCAPGASVAVIVIGGPRGNGYSVLAATPNIASALPGLLRTVANQLERDLLAVLPPQGNA